MHVSLLVEKARASPLPYTTIPRLELQAAVLFSNMETFLKGELEYPDVQYYFWSDSMVVLGCIHTDTKCFHVYVATRVAQMQKVSEPSS